MTNTSHPPHYHLCGHCHKNPTNFACFDTSTEPHAHRGVYQLCEHCARRPTVIAPTEETLERSQGLMPSA